VVLSSESQHKGSSPSYVRSSVVSEELMRPGLWLGLVLCVLCSVMTLIIGWQGGHLACKYVVSLLPEISLMEQVEEGGPDWELVDSDTTGRIAELPLNGSSCSIVVVIFTFLSCRKVLSSEALQTA